VRLVPSLSVITAALSTMRYNQAALDLVCGELETLGTALPPEAGATKVEARAVRPRGTLSLQAVDFRYPDAAGDALTRVSFEIKLGEVVAFVGPSGAGKSTLIDIILGLLPPARGEVRVDGRDIRLDLPGWQRQIGYVPQEIYLLDDTIRRNIALGMADEEIDEQSINRAVRAAQLDALVRTLPMGLDTVIGNWGVRLSGGQRQRMGVARALYHDPGVLVLDEATSALDHETERELIAAITRQRGERTIIMVAHRLTTVQDCDRLYLLEEGRIEDEGSFADLLSRHLKLARVPSDAKAGERP
jgi:ATP-binding cassette subfamily C protein